MTLTPSGRIREVLKFVVVGAINTVLDLLVLNVLLVVSHQGQRASSFSIFKAISFLVAVVNSYLMNKYWTFAGNTSRDARVEFGQFVAVSLVGLAVNNVVATLVFQHSAVAADSPVLRPTLAGAAGSAAGLIWNYAGYKVLVFRDRHSDAQPPAS